VNQVHVAVSHKAGETEENVGDFAMLVRQVSIEKLHDEGRKLEPGFVGEYANRLQHPHDPMTNQFLKQLMKPKDNQNIQFMEQFPFKKTEILELTTEVNLAVSSQPIVIQDIRAPCKVFGNIHGNFVDMMRFFDIWN